MAEEKNALGMTNDEVKSELRLSENQYKMYEKTIKETERTLKSKLNPDGTKAYSKEKIAEQVMLIKNAQDDTREKYMLLGGNVEDLSKKSSVKDRLKDTNVLKIEKDNSALDLVNSYKEVSVLDEVKNQIDPSHDLFSSAFDEVLHDNGFDLIPLPSNGECYKNKMSKLPVLPLCANDENMIIAPNLYRENLILDYILKAKIYNNEIDPMDLLEGDREAILLYLRRDAYGDEYPIKATDESTGTRFDTTVDLSQLNYKEFKLSGDTNGWFSYTLPYAGNEIKFKFLTHRDIVKLDKATSLEDKKTIKHQLEQTVELLDGFIDNDDRVESSEKVKIRQAIRTIENWGENIDEDDSMLFNHEMTNRLELQIMSVDSITDRDYIRSFVRAMKPKDARALRLYIMNNEPGVDYNFKVEKPESLGGGSIDVFLQFDKYIFLNLPRV